MKAPSLSANTLFHFTKTIDNLESILRKEFYPNYSLENWELIAGNNFEIAIPMVSFCDIPLSQIQNHTYYYGNCALGLTKKWGMKNNICPVLYTYKKATTATNIFAAVGIIDNDVTKDILINYSFYMKPYEGKLWRNDKYIGLWRDGKYTDEDINFYDEREWRYIPEIDEQTDRIGKYMSPDDFKNKEYMTKQNEKLKSKKLSFEPNDIKYIIVEKESEILDMVHKVRDIKDKFPPEDVEVLITRIISMEHIKEDF